MPDYHPAQVGAWIAAVLTFIVTTVASVLSTLRAVKESQIARQQRTEELRWKQAEAGKSLNDEMQMDKQAGPAMQMLDDPCRRFPISESQSFEIRPDDIRKALDPGTEPDAKVIYIRDCFDCFFYYLAMFEHYIRNNLIVADDVAFPVGYYIRLLAKFQKEVDGYLQKYGLDRARSYLASHPEWPKIPGSMTSDSSRDRTTGR